MSHSERIRTIGAITEKTVIPLGVFVILVGGIVWLTSIYAESHQNAVAISELKLKQDEYNRTVQSIDSRLSHIEGVLSDK